MTLAFLQWLLFASVLPYLINQDKPQLPSCLCYAKKNRREQILSIFFKRKKNVRQPWWKTVSKAFKRSSEGEGWESGMVKSKSSKVPGSTHYKWIHWQARISQKQPPNLQYGDNNMDRMVALPRMVVSKVLLRFWESWKSLHEQRGEQQYDFHNCVAVG